MTTERLALLRGNLVNLRDWTDDYRAAVLAQDAIRRCNECKSVRDYESLRRVPLGKRCAAIACSMEADLDKLADALGIAPDGERVVKTKLVITGFLEGQPEALPLDEIGIAPDGAKGEL